MLNKCLWYTTTQRIVMHIIAIRIAFFVFVPYSRRNLHFLSRSMSPVPPVPHSFLSLCLSLSLYLPPPPSLSPFISIAQSSLVLFHDLRYIKIAYTQKLHHKCMAASHNLWFIVYTACQINSKFGVVSMHIAFIVLRMRPRHAQ